jgi:hypothetical protein
MAGRVGGSQLPDVITDANGRYELTNITAAVLFIETAPEADYKFLCPSYPLIVSAASFLSNLPVVHVSWSGNTLPPGMGWIGTSVSGVVSERLGGGLHPVAGATVTLDGGIQDPSSTTSATGFYMICSVVGTDQLRTISAEKNGYTRVTREIFGGGDSLVDLELVR